MNDEYDDFAHGGDRARYARRIDELIIGDQIFTPALRWETVTRLDRGERFSWSTRVFTDRTGDDYGWSLANHHELPSLRAWQTRGTPAVRVESTGRRVIAFVGTTAELYRSRSAPVLTEAIPAGRGQGWDVVDRPNGGDPVHTRVASKAAALSAVKRAARTHATALGLTVRIG